MEILDAVKDDDLASVRRFLDCDASLANASGPVGTVLSCAAGGGHVQIMTALLKAGADPNAKGGLQESTALHTAAAFGPLAAVDCLLANGADVNARDALGQTPLVARIYDREKRLIKTVRR